MLWFILLVLICHWGSKIVVGHYYVPVKDDMKRRGMDPENPDDIIKYLDENRDNIVFKDKK